VEIGIVTSVEINHKNVDTARKGQEVCLKIEPIPGDAPKMFGRHFDETDMLVSKVSVHILFYTRVGVNIFF
jgi:translation initiation factor 5B